MKKILLVLLAFFSAGCVSITYPDYIRDKYPYKKRFIASYEQTLEAVSQTLNELDWAVISSHDPEVYERSKVVEEDIARQLLIFAKRKKGSWVPQSIPEKLNIYIRTDLSNNTEIEIRYLKISSVAFKKLYDYKSNRLVNKILDRIEELTL